MNLKILGFLSDDVISDTSELEGVLSQQRERLVPILLSGGWPTSKCIQLFGTTFESFEVFRAVVFDNLKLYPPIWGSAACEI